MLYLSLPFIILVHFPNTREYDFWKFSLNMDLRFTYSCTSILNTKVLKSFSVVVVVVSGDFVRGMVGWSDVSKLFVLCSQIISDPLKPLHIFFSLFVVAAVYNVTPQICTFSFEYWLVFTLLVWLVISYFYSITSDFLAVVISPSSSSWSIRMVVLWLFWHI